MYNVITFVMPQKHLCKTKKNRAVKRQGCCGLYACLYVMGLSVKTAEDIEKFRTKFRQQGLVQRRASWTGGTTRLERKNILQHLGAKTESVPFAAKTLGKLLREKAIYQTRNQYVVTITGHVMYLRTNKTKTKLFLVDQRGVRMKPGDVSLVKNLRQRVKDVLLVHKTDEI